MRPYLDPRDHAFANGPVFARPASASEALDLFDDPQDGGRLLKVFEAFDRGADCGEGLRLGLHARLITPDGEKRVSIGRDCAIRGVIRCEDAGRVAISDLVYIGDGVIISARTSVEIGEATLIAHGAQVFDNDTHPIDPFEREAHYRSILKLGPKGQFRIGAAPVKIGRRCWLGFSSTVMKGVTLGEGSIVAAGAVVVSDVAARCIVAGNPARRVKRIKS